jgi:N-acetylmuramoyl-L-alanine amidase
MIYSSLRYSQFIDKSMLNIRTLVITVILLGIFNCSPQEQINISALKDRYQLQLARYLVKDAEIYNQVRIDDDGIKLYESQTAWEDYDYEFILPWGDLERFKNICEIDPAMAFDMYENYDHPRFVVNFPKPTERAAVSKFEPTPEQPLKGLRIALDAGHIAGDLKTAKLEGKYIEMKYSGEEVSFWEADLAWHTSNYLHRQLEKHGAIVMTTHQYGKTAFGMDYDTWYERFDSQEEKPDKSRMFWRYFRHKDNDERVKIVNAFRPDLTMIMHYNVDGGNRPWKKPCRTQYSMAFTGGAYMKGELFSKERRFNLLRLLVTDDIEESAKFSSDVLEYLREDCEIPILPGNSTQKYVNAIGIRTNYQGVYARNLALSGRIYGTLCYAEPLFQDHKSEVLRLNERDFNFEGEMIPSRIVEIAKAYEKAILKYAKSLDN